MISERIKSDMEIEEIRRMRLREVAKALGGPAKLGRKLEKSDSRISQIIGKNPTRNIGTNQAREMEVKLGLVRGALDRPPEAESAVAKGLRAISGDAVSVDRLSARGSMGSGHELAEVDHVVEKLTLTADWVKQTLPRLSAMQNLKVISAYGDSMMPTFTDGDLLLVDAGIRAVDIDGVFVLRTNARLYIKRVRQKLDGTFEVRSDNPLAGTPEELSGKNKVDVLGRVVWAWNGRKL